MSGYTHRIGYGCAAADAEVERLRSRLSAAEAQVRAWSASSDEYRERALAAEAAREAVERECGMPLDMIATTLNAHRVTAQEDRERADAAESREAALREALKRYGRHEPGCRWNPAQGTDCTCGLDPALGRRESLSLAASPRTAPPEAAPEWLAPVWGLIDVAQQRLGEIVVERRADDAEEALLAAGLLRPPAAAREEGRDE